MSASPPLVRSLILCFAPSTNSEVWQLNFWRIAVFPDKQHIYAYTREKKLYKRGEKKIETSIWHSVVLWQNIALYPHKAKGCRKIDSTCLKSEGTGKKKHLFANAHRNAATWAIIRKEKSYFSIDSTQTSTAPTPAKSSVVNILWKTASKIFEFLALHSCHTLDFSRRVFTRSH